MTPILIRCLIDTVQMSMLSNFTMTGNAIKYRSHMRYYSDTSPLSNWITGNLYVPVISADKLILHDLKGTHTQV